MELRITGRHVKLPAKATKYAHEKLEPLSRYWDRTRYLEVVFEKANLGWKIEAKVHVQRGAGLVATVEHEDALAAIDLVHDKVEGLLIRAKEKGRTKRVRAGRGTASKGATGKR